MMIHCMKKISLFLYMFVFLHCVAAESKSLQESVYETLHTMKPRQRWGFYGQFYTCFKYKSKQEQIEIAKLCLGYEQGNLYNSKKEIIRETRKLCLMKDLLPKHVHFSISHKKIEYAQGLLNISSRILKRLKSERKNSDKP